MFAALAILLDPRQLAQTPRRVLPLRVHVVVRVHVGRLRVRLRGLDLLLAANFEFRQRAGSLRAPRLCASRRSHSASSSASDAFALGDGLARFLGHEHGFDHLPGVVLAVGGVRVRLPGRRTVGGFGGRGRGRVARGGRDGVARSLGLYLGLGLGLDGELLLFELASARGGAGADGGASSFDLGVVFFLLGGGGLVVVGRGGRGGAGDDLGRANHAGGATARGRSPSSPRDRTAGAAGARRPRSARDANARGASSSSDRTRPRPRPSPAAARDRRGGGAPWWPHPKIHHPARASRASRSRSSHAGLLPFTRTVSSARVRPDILATRDRPPHGDLRRAREPPAEELRDDEDGAVAARTARGRRRQRFLAASHRLRSRADLSSEASGARDAL